MPGRSDPSPPDLRARLCIGGVGLTFEGGEWPLLAPALEPFRGSSPDEVVITVGDHRLPDLEVLEEERLFDTGTTWSLYRGRGRNVIELRAPPLGPRPYRVAVFDEEFRRGQVYGRTAQALRGGGDEPADPIGFPLWEVLMVCLLARGRGLLVHACGLDVDGKGYLFAGNSGHGKTTTARLWRDRGVLLNDDRVVLREHEGCFWIYGTPWHGENPQVAAHGVPLEKVFFLRQADTNHAAPRTGAAAAAMLLARAFPPLWDADGMRYTADLSARLAAQVPCFELGFVPDQSAVECARCAS